MGIVIDKDFKMLREWQEESKEYWKKNPTFTKITKRLDDITECMIDEVVKNFPDCNYNEYVIAACQSILKLSSRAVETKTVDYEHIEKAYFATNDTAQALMNGMTETN